MQQPPPPFFFLVQKYLKRASRTPSKEEGESVCRLLALLVQKYSQEYLERASRTRASEVCACNSPFFSPHQKKKGPPAGQVRHIHT
jgi:hypothetical protein